MHWILFSFAWILLILHQANCLGFFELRFKSFENKAGKDFTGECCSREIGFNKECSRPCRTRFRVCLKEYQVNITNSPCTFGDVMTPIFGENSFWDTRQEWSVIRLPFQFKWLGTFTLIVEAWHKGNNSDTVGDVLIARHISQRWLGISDKWMEDSQHTPYTKMKYEYRVTCDSHYYGEGCEIFCRPLNNGFGHYTCSPLGERVCLSGWIGEYCVKPLCLQGCDKEHGFCTKPNECKCHTGWEGPLCDQCTRHPGCVHGTCVKPWDCLCDEGWGGLFCNQDLNYCTNHKPCLNGTCFNTGQGSYTCTCSAGFTGTNCEIEMGDCSANTCLNNGTCKNNGTDNICVCPPEFQGARCEIPIQQLCSCKNGGKCTNIDGIYKCVCSSGYKGKHCQLSINNCFLNQCQNGGTCEKGPNGAGCVCPLGFQGEKCELQQPCSCRNGGTCLKIGGIYQCLCPIGYKGKICEIEFDNCLPNLCQNGGTCENTTNGPRCICPSEFTGDVCQKYKGNCRSNPCLNGGTCTNEANQFHCQCVPGYMGDFCAEIDHCAKEPCENGGSCTPLTNDYVCNCTFGFMGKNCSVEMNECASQPCQHGGKCILLQQGFECQCSTEFLGIFCEEAASSVAPSARISSDSGLTAEHVVVIATLSTFVPVLVLIAAVVVMCHKQRRKREQAQADEEARLQNEQNTHNSFAKRGGGLSSDTHMIKNSWNKCTNNVLGSNIPSPDECSLSNISVTENGECYPKPMQVIDGRPVYTLHRTRSHKQLNTEPGSRTSALLSAKLHDPDYESHMRLPIDKRISLLSNSSSVCTSSDSSYLKRPPLDKEPVYVIEEHFHRSDVLHSGLFATEV